jgi:Ca2+-binding RTX toxin-like protein
VRVNLTTGTAIGGGGSDTLTGIENIRGTASTDTLTGDAGANRLDGGDSADSLFGEGGNDILLAGSGNDTLAGGDGDDVIFGGAGSDSIVGGAGSDTAQYQDALAGVTVSLRISGFQDTGGGGSDKLIQMENVIGSNFADVLTGNGVANILTGAGGVDVLIGGAGNDSLSGGADNDTLTGEDGIDKLHGGSGDDTLEGGLGRDILTGAAGADTFIFSRVIGADTLTDFGTDDLLAMRATSFGLTPGVFSASLLQFGSAATGSEAVFLYDEARRTLFFDADGAGAGAAEAIVGFSTPVSLNPGDFLLI